MKKTLLFIVVLFFFSLTGAMSQSLILFNEDGQLGPDASFGKTGMPSDPEIAAYLYVKNNTASTQSVLMKKVIIDTIPGSINSFCWGTNCYPPFVYESPEAVDIEAGQTDSISFSAHYEALGTIGTSIIRYVFFLRDNPSDTVSARGYFMSFPSGVENKTSESLVAYPNPADSKCTVNYNVAGNATILVRDVLGSVKYQSEVNGNGSFVMNTSSFSNGIYFCTIQVNGKSGITKKIVVKH